MTTLVTGGTGFVGIHVVRQLAEQGGMVVSLSSRGVLDDVARQFLGEASRQVVCLKADVLELDRLRQGIREFGVETVVHGAAITAIGELEREVSHQAVMVNVGGTATVLEASRMEGVTRFIYLSSGTVYGSGDPQIPLREETLLNPKGIYAITKHAGEQIVSRYLDLFPIEGAILRISAPYGPLERPTGRRELMSPIYGWCRAAKAGEEVTLTDDLQRDFTYAVDMARGIVLTCRVPVLRHRVYNISSGCNVFFSEILGVLAKIRPQFKVRRVEVSSTSDFFRESLRGPLDISRAKEDLGFCPEYDLEGGLRSYLDWLERFPV